MSRRSSTAVRRSGARLAQAVALRLGEQIKRARVRRRLTQEALAARIGIDQTRQSQLEAGLGAGAPLEVWFALGEALGIPFRADLARDPQEGTADAGHLALQELVLRRAREAGWSGRFELPSRPSDPTRSTDVGLIDRPRRRLALIECWNTFGDLGAAARSSERKRAEAAGLAAVQGADDGPYEVGVCWVVRDTRRNRELLARYPHIVAARFPASSAAWVRALTSGGAMPQEAGLVWADPSKATIFARREARLRP